MVKQENSTGQDLISDNKNISDGKRYVDMTEEELNQSIKEENHYIEVLKPANYELKDIEEDKRQIEKHQSIIKEKKRVYLEIIKYNQECIKKNKKELKRNEKRLREKLEHIDKRRKFIKIIEHIRDNLKENPNCYK